ncbi:MAG: hypothetical protein R3E12_13905 [Candidatus Eisenbacteria bacterium]
MRPVFPTRRGRALLGRRCPRRSTRRLPSTTTLDVQAQKRYRLWDQQLSLFLEASNVLDARNIVNLTPVNFPEPPSGGRDEYLAYYSETGRAGGAYEGEDLDGDRRGDWVALHDPRVFGPSRAVRMGVSFLF